MGEFSMEQKERHLINIHEKAEEAGIESPVVIDSSLLKMLTPNPYLASIGITLDDRMGNLLELVKAKLKNDKDAENSDKKYFIPFMVLKGPLVREELLSVIMNIESKGGNTTVIMVSAADNDDSSESVV
jgi:hypothetical protein